VYRRSDRRLRKFAEAIRSCRSRGRRLVTGLNGSNNRLAIEAPRWHRSRMTCVGKVVNGAGLLPPDLSENLDHYVPGHSKK